MTVGKEEDHSRSYLVCGRQECAKECFWKMAKILGLWVLWIGRKWWEMCMMLVVQTASWRDVGKEEGSLKKLLKVGNLKVGNWRIRL